MLHRNVYVKLKYLVSLLRVQDEIGVRSLATPSSRLLADRNYLTEHEALRELKKYVVIMDFILTFPFILIQSYKKIH